MKILLVSPFPLSEPRGNSIAARRLEQGFLARGHPVRTISGPHFPDTAELSRILQSFQPDMMLLLHALRCAEVLARLDWKTPVPAVISLRGTDFNLLPRDAAKTTILGRVLDCCRGVVIFHEKARDHFSLLNSTWSRKTRVIPNGVAPPPPGRSFRDTLPRARGREPLVFLLVAGMRAVKNPLFVAENLASLIGSHPEITLLHAGPSLDSDYASRFESYRASRPWIHSLGEVPYERMGSLYATADVFVSASLAEGMPHAVIEAMGAGLPLLLSTIEGHQNLAKAGREALYFENESGFQAAALELIQSTDLRRRLGSSARKRAERNPGAKIEIEGYLQFFEDLLAFRN